MPTQRTGIGNEETLKVIAVDVHSGEVVSQSGTNIEESATNRSINFLDVPISVNLNNKSEGINSVGYQESVTDTSDSSNGTNSTASLNSERVNSTSATTTVILAKTVPSSSNTDLRTSVNSNTEIATTSQSLKRQLSSPSSPIIHKVIITKNPNSSQPQVVPVQINQGSANSGQTTNFQTMSGGAISLLPQGGQTPTKSFTISPHGILSPNKQIISPNTPLKLGAMTVNKIPISPAKTPTKITMIPVTIGKSPQRSLIPASGGISVLSKNLSDNTTVRPVTVTQHSGVKQTLITMSPSKVVKQGAVIQQPSHIQLQPGQTLAGKQIITVPQQGVKQVQIPMSSGLTVQGSRFQYVRLVSPVTQAAGSAVRSSTQLTSIVPATPVVASTNAGNVQSQPVQQMKITLPLPVKSKPGTVTQPVQRIILPAAPNQIRTSVSQVLTTTTLAPIRPSVPSGTSLPAGATILASGGSGGTVQSFALVPASYVAQLTQLQSKPQQTMVQQPVPIQQAPPQPIQARQDFIPIISNDTSSSANSRSSNGAVIEPTGARPRKPCNCTKSQCLKLYCDCFANGEFCHNCNCNNCANNLEHEEERSRAIKSCLDRNPMAFHPKIGKGKDGERDRKHNKGCNCKRSGCLKNYCECYEAKIMCSGSCKCVGCKNFEESPERKTLMHLADAAEVRVQQQTAAKSKLSSQISGIPSRPPISSATGERLPYTFITSEVAEATCACLLAQAEEAERLKMPPVVQERMVIEEFGRCLMQIIDSANKTKDSDT